MNIARKKYFAVIILTGGLYWVNYSLMQSSVDPNMTLTKQIKRIEGEPLFNLIMVDFDGTITTEDTCSLFYQATHLYMNGSQEIKFNIDEKWNSIGSIYMETHYETLNDEMKNIDYKIPNIKALETFLCKMASVDHISTQNVEKSGILNGVNTQGLQSVAYTKVTIQDNCENVLRSILPQLEIVSVSWSGELIKYKLESIISDKECIHANWLLSNNNNTEKVLVANGTITNASHKRDVVNNLLNKQKTNKLGISVFVGDSITDLLAMLASDIGIVVGESETTLNVIQKFGLKIEPLESILNLSVRNLVRLIKESKFNLYKASSWHDIETLLLV